jgi:hypothetical protein
MALLTTVRNLCFGGELEDYVVLQLSALSLDLLQDGDIGVGVFPIRITYPKRVSPSPADLRDRLTAQIPAS